jgi:ankyrin repeat protein
LSELLTLDEAKELIALCRAGKLYEIEKWIAVGKSIRTPPQMKKAPLQVAIDTGFHSLIELLVRKEDSQTAKNRALSDAVTRRRLDLVQLLVSHGAEIQSMPLADVLLAWEPEMIRFFLENGADTATGAPFAAAFGEKVRTALRPFVEYKKTHPELARVLQEQADRALRHFCHEGDLKWVNLLLWAGANPRTLGPTLDEQWADDPECYTTALREACAKGNLEILRKLKPDPQTDDLSDLLSSAAFATSKEAIDYLLARGAPPNDKRNGGSSALDRCFWHLGFGTFDSFFKKRLSTKGDVSKVFDCMRLLVEHGALWRPEDRSTLNSVRQALYKCEPVVTVDCVKLLAGNKAAPEETLERLLDAPRMRQHLSALGMRLFASPRDRLKRRASASAQYSPGHWNAATPLQFLKIGNSHEPK